MEEKKKFCPALWFSGFFCLGFVVHLVRFILKASVVVNGRDIPVSLSGWLFVVFGVLSAVTLWVGLKKPCCKKDGQCEHGKGEGNRG